MEQTSNTILPKIQSNKEKTQNNQRKSYVKTPEPQPAMAVKILGPRSLAGLMA